MAITTVAQFAAALNRPASTLLEQLQHAGVSKASISDALTDADKEKLLAFLRSSHGTQGSDRKKITLTKKSTSEIKQADTSGKARTIQVDVRKKRVFVKREAPLASEQTELEAEELRREPEAPSERPCIEAEANLCEATALADTTTANTKVIDTLEEAKARKAAGAKAQKAAAAKARDAIKEAKARKAKEAAKAREAAEAFNLREVAEAAREREAPPKMIEKVTARLATAIQDATALSGNPGAELASRQADRVVDASGVDRKRLNDVDRRRKSAEIEAKAIRAMMSESTKVRSAEESLEIKSKDYVPEIKESIQKPTLAVSVNDNSLFPPPVVGSGRHDQISVSRVPRARIAFLSYRRDDSSGHAGRLHDRLTDALGEDQVFMDVDNIPPGEDFVEVIKASVWASSIMLLVIGPRWIGIASRDGRRRIDDPNDFVRLEISSALERNIKIIPVLVGGARMPLEDELPIEIRSLARRQAAEVSHARFRADSDKLIRAIKSQIDGEKAKAAK